MEYILYLYAKYNQSKIYAKLSKEYPEGLIPVSKEEQEEFEKWLGV